MTTAKIVNEQREVVANLSDLKHESRSNAYTANIDFVNAPAGLLEALRDLERNVDTQQLGAAERNQEVVDSFNLSVAFNGKSVQPICDLFVNRDSECSFRLRPAVYPWTKHSA